MSGVLNKAYATNSGELKICTGCAGNVATFADLPTTGVLAGDRYSVLDEDGAYYMYDGTTWELAGGEFTFPGSSGGVTFDQVYPIGSIYMSVANVNPSSLFGGVWEQLENKFLLGAGSSYTAGDTGGEATHTLTVDEIPAHTHNTSLYYINNPDSTARYSANWTTNNGATRMNTGSTGGGQAHNNMPPYLAVYMWKRTE